MSLNISNALQLSESADYKQAIILYAFISVDLILTECFNSLSETDIDNLYVEMYPAIPSQQPGRLKFGELLNAGVKYLIQNVNIYIDILQILAQYKLKDGDDEKKKRFFKKFKDIKPHEMDAEKFIELLHAIANFAVLNLEILSPILKAGQLKYILQIKDGSFVQMPRAHNRATLPDVNYDSSNFYSAHLLETFNPKNQNNLDLVLTLNCGVARMVRTADISQSFSFGEVEDGAVKLYTFCNALLDISLLSSEIKGSEVIHSTI